MDPNIVTQFIVASAPGIATLSDLTRTITRESYLPLLPKAVVEQYISDTLSEKTLRDDVNSMSDQWLVVYSNEHPAGYARLTSRGERPGSLSDKRAIRLADFGIVNAYADGAVRQSLYDKCLSVCRSYEAVWLNKYLDSDHIAYFESVGFVRQQETVGMFVLPVPIVCMIKQFI